MGFTAKMHKQLPLIWFTRTMYKSTKKHINEDLKQNFYASAKLNNNSYASH